VFVPSIDLIRRTIDCEVSYTLSRMRVLEQIDGNPIGIASRRVGKNGWALMARRLPVPSFNAVVGLGPGDESELEAVSQWYLDNDVNAQIEIVPGREDATLLRELTRLGYHHSGFHVSVIARPGDAVAPDPAVAVERVTDRTLEDFLDAYIAGRGLPDGEGFKRNVRPWLGLPGWSLFLGRVEGNPAAAAILYLRDGFGYLADGFRAHQKESLEELAQRTAEEVRRTRRAQLLPPLAPRERRLVHLALAEAPDVMTESEGDGYLKRVAVRLK
jgi:hypothetical protein